MLLMTMVPKKLSRSLALFSQLSLALFPMVISLKIRKKFESLIGTHLSLGVSLVELLSCRS